MMKQRLISTVSLGLALFSMFFGSGNLIFPIFVGKASEGYLLTAISGLCLTAIAVPFLGAWVMWLHNGRYENFFSKIAPGASFWFPFLCLSLMGPFGVLARCITVAHGSVLSLFPGTSLSLFSLLMCGVIFFVTYHKSWIVPILGRVLTPFLIISLSVIGAFGLLYSPTISQTPSSILNIFFSSLSQGYQTMDLLAAFFFSVFALEHIKKQTWFTQKEQNRIFLHACLIGASLLSIFYGVLVYLGAAYREILHSVPAEQLLAKIAFETIHGYAASILCIAVILACLTTAVVLTELFAEFLQKRMFKQKASYTSCITITLIIAWLITRLKFSGIAAIIGPILELLYPALIVLTLLELVRHYRQVQVSNWPVWLTFAISGCYYLVQRA